MYKQSWSSCDVDLQPRRFTLLIAHATKHEVLSKELSCCVKSRRYGVVVIREVISLFFSVSPKNCQAVENNSDNWPTHTDWSRHQEQSLQKLPKNRPGYRDLLSLEHLLLLEHLIGFLMFVDLDQLMAKMEGGDGPLLHPGQLSNAPFPPLIHWQCWYLRE